MLAQYDLMPLPAVSAKLQTAVQDADFTLLL
jgi:hypothetical protein